MTNDKKFAAIRERYDKSQERLGAIQDVFLKKYGLTSPPSSWLTKGELAKLTAAHAAETKEHDKMFALLDDISPRNWRSGIAAWWVLNHLTYDDAITRGPLSTTPTAAYGYSVRSAEQFAEALS
jgi:hypothetical protein